MQNKAQIGREVVALYATLFSSYKPTHWVNIGKKYFSIKMLCNHLAVAELNSFVEMLQAKYGDVFITANNRIATSGDGRGDTWKEEKIVVRFHREQ